MNLSEKVLFTAAAFTGLTAYYWAVTTVAAILHTPPAIVVFLLGVVVLIWHQVDKKRNE